ncbi:DUF2283 domain-containing protein [Thermostichus vulcanus]|uniref:DUF2283 domain-containing protein n=1 Tax=Thermostichus vulcanus str. 'Rupite' TaxID=2813851 RepID=A0ABT0CFD1_THEVL|nr:DUF2283 domain-containing protein [Thermostichus vulcanus]MCJ2544491.1 DUF2283 domain-containing protein [Thermostichus vulcanus str. 'Rupite']
MRQFTYDAEVDAAYIRLTDERIEETDTLESGFIVDYDQYNQPVGIEVLGVSRLLPNIALLPHPKAAQQLIELSGILIPH